MHVRIRRGLTACGVCLSLAACSPIDPSKNTIVPISGTLQPGGTGASHLFKAARNGELEVTMTSVVPPPSSGGTIGIALGQILNGGCALLPGYVASVIVNRTTQFYTINKGDYCLLVYDPGVITVSTNYAGNISHP